MFGGSQDAGPESPFALLVGPSTGTRLSGSLAMDSRLSLVQRDAPICQSYDSGMTWSIWTFVARDLVHSMTCPVYGSFSVSAMTTQSEPDRKRRSSPSRFKRSFRESQPLCEKGTSRGAESIQA